MLNVDLSRNEQQDFYIQVKMLLDLIELSSKMIRKISLNFIKGKRIEGANEEVVAFKEAKNSAFNIRLERERDLYERIGEHGK